MSCPTNETNNKRNLAPLHQLNINKEWREHAKRPHKFVMPNCVYEYVRQSQIVILAKFEPDTVNGEKCLCRRRPPIAQ